MFWFGVLAPPVALVVLAVSLRRHRQDPRWERHRTAILDVAVALALLGVAAVTLLPIADYHTGIEWGLQLVPMVSIIDVVAASVDASVAVRIVFFNILLFVPLGFLLALRTGRWMTTLGVAFLVSVSVETLQAVLPLGRTANVDDIILNTAGAVVGWGLATAVGWIWPLHLGRGVQADKSHR